MKYRLKKNTKVLCFYQLQFCVKTLKRHVNTLQRNKQDGEISFLFLL